MNENVDVAAHASPLWDGECGSSNTSIGSKHSHVSVALTELHHMRVHNQGLYHKIIANCESCQHSTSNIMSASGSVHTFDDFNNAKWDKAFVTNLLMDESLNVHARGTHYGATPLLIAAFANHPAAVRKLIANGSDITAMNTGPSKPHAYSVRTFLLRKREAGEAAIEALFRREVLTAEETIILQELQDHFGTNVDVDGVLDPSLSMNGHVARRDHHSLGVDHETKARMRQLQQQVADYEARLRVAETTSASQAAHIAQLETLLADRDGQLQRANEKIAELQHSLRKQSATMISRLQATEKDIFAGFRVISRVSGSQSDTFANSRSGTSACVADTEFENVPAHVGDFRPNFSER